MTEEWIESEDGKSRWKMIRYTCPAAACGLPTWVLPERSVTCCPYCGEVAKTADVGL